MCPFTLHFESIFIITGGLRPPRNPGGLKWDRHPQNPVNESFKRGLIKSQFMRSQNTPLFLGCLRIPIFDLF
jgi:hypothetical protein